MIKVLTPDDLRAADCPYVSEQITKDNLPLMIEWVEKKYNAQWVQMTFGTGTAYFILRKKWYHKLIDFLSLG